MSISLGINSLRIGGRRRGGGTAAPSAVSGLTTTTISDTQINIVWTDPASDGVKIYLSTDGGANYGEPTTVLNGIGYANLTGLTTATSYTIKLVAYTGAVESDPVTITAGTFNDAMVEGWNMHEDTNAFATGLGDKPFGAVSYSPALHYNGKTYIAYNGLNDNPYIITVDDVTGASSDPVQIGTSELVDSDDHGQPVIHFNSEGYILCLYDSHTTAMKYAISDNPEDISAWTAQVSPATGTYPQFLQFSDNSVYLFYRILGPPTCRWGYKKSTDGGVTWGADVVISEDIAYWVFRKGVGDTIHATGFGNNTTEQTRLNVFYIFFNGTNWVNIGGDIQPSPIILAGNNCIAYDSGDYYCPLADVRCDSGNKPYIIFTRSTVELDITNLDIVFMKHNGTDWIRVDLDISGQLNTIIVSAFDIVSDILHLYANNYGNSADPYRTVFEHWMSNDLGVTWSKKEVIRTGNVNYPYIVRDYVSSAKLIFSERRNNDLVFQNSGYLWGDSGFRGSLKSLTVPSINHKITTTLKNIALENVNGSYQFTGDNAKIIVVPDNDILSFATGTPDAPFSVTVKINVSGVTAVQRIIWKGSVTVTEYAISIASSKLVFTCFDPAGVIQIIARAPFTTVNEEVFICVTYDGGGSETGMEIFINNVESQNEQTHTGTYVGMSNTDGPLYVGRQAFVQYPLNGYMKELKLWNKVLTPTEMGYIKDNVPGW